MSKKTVTALAIIFVGCAGCLHTTSAGNFVSSIKPEPQGGAMIERCEVRVDYTTYFFLIEPTVEIRRVDCRREPLALSARP